MVHRTAQEIVGHSIESVDNEGYTIWLADFLPEEIQPFNQHLKNDPFRDRFKEFFIL
jgi:hypothetical protein